MTRPETGAWMGVEIVSSSRPTIWPAATVSPWPTSAGTSAPKPWANGTTTRAGNGASAIPESDAMSPLSCLKTYPPGNVRA